MTTSTASLPPLASPERLALWLGETPDNPRVAEALRSASDRFRGHVRHPVTLIEDDTLTLDGTGGRVLMLPAFPVRSVSVLATDGWPGGLGNTPVPMVVPVRWSAVGYIARRDGGIWPDEPRCIEVTYSHGWPEGEIPADITEAVLDQARAMFTIERGLGQYAAGGQSQSVSMTDAVGITEQWSRAVARWSTAGARC